MVKRCRSPGQPALTTTTGQTSGATGITNVAKLVANELLTCALLTSGDYTCWGASNYGLTSVVD